MWAIAGLFLFVKKQNMLGQAVTHDSYLPAVKCLLPRAGLGGTGRRSVPLSYWLRQPLVGSSTG